MSNSAIVEMLERRERVAQMSYDEIRDRMQASDLGLKPMTAEEVIRERRELHRASARWTEAQEALSEARRIKSKDEMLNSE